MVLDNTVEKEIGGKKYVFKLPIKLLFKAERNLTRKSMILTMMELPLNLEDVYVLFKYSLLGGQNLSEDEVDELYFAAIDELGLPELQTLVLEVLQKSGAFGKAEPKKA